MKKVFSLIMLLGMVVGTASAAPYYQSTPTYGAVVSYDWQPVYSIEGVYSFADKDGIPDTAGARLNFSLYSNAAEKLRHQFGITLGYESGKEKEDGVRTTLTRVPLTLGYDLNVRLADSVMLDLGAKAGYAFGKVEERVHIWQNEETTGGFTFGLGAGIKVQCSESIYVKVGYEFGRTYFQDYGESHLNFGQHSIILGAGAVF